jgi:peptidoglycan hydrolase CwlO-like protein
MYKIFFTLAILLMAVGSVTAETYTTSASDTDRDVKNNDQIKKDVAGIAETGSPEKQKKKVSYGGKSDDAWKADYRKLNAEINDVQTQMDERKARLNNPDNLTRARYRGIELEIKDLEERMTGLRSRLSALDDAASIAGVPYELRK